LAEATDSGVGAQAFGDGCDRVPHAEQCGDRSRRASREAVVITDDLILNHRVAVTTSTRDLLDITDPL
jgi:hypothetical protein